MEKDLTEGIDRRGDQALFISSIHFADNGWDLKPESAEKIPSGTHFFRLIDEEGEQMHQHGWIENQKVIQWG